MEHRGYVYQCNRVKKDEPLKYWQCALYKKCGTERCKARAVMITPKYLNVTVDHNHPPSSVYEQ